MTDATTPFDPQASAFTNARFPLVDFYRAHLQAGGGALIEGRTFTDCLIEGPALMLVQDGVNFDGVNFGPTGGDMRNMLFRPMGGRAIGAIPVRDCVFLNCRFSAIGVTGADDLLQMLAEQVKTVG